MQIKSEPAHIMQALLALFLNPNWMIDNRYLFQMAINLAMGNRQLVSDCV